MATYLYCVLTPPIPEALPAVLMGIAGSPVRALVPPGGRLEAWVSTIDDAALHVSGQALATQALVHNEVVEAALRTGRTPLPARYGSRFDDDAACAADLRRRAAALGDILDRLTGGVEMTVLIVPCDAVLEPTTAVPRPRPHEAAAGRRYLESVRERAVRVENRRRAAELEARRITSVLGAIVRDESERLSAAGVMSVAHLISREDVETYRRTIAKLRPTDGYRLVVAEPRAPYSFASGNGELGGHDSSSRNSNE